MVLFRICDASRYLPIQKLVEAGGIEPPSASTPPQGLHAYPAL